jgi:hypothetical protein
MMLPVFNRMGCGLVHSTVSYIDCRVCMDQSHRLYCVTLPPPESAAAATTQLLLAILLISPNAQARGYVYKQGLYIKLGHDHFLIHPFRSSDHSTLLSLSY